MEPIRGSPVVGQIWFNTTTLQLKIYDGAVRVLASLANKLTDFAAPSGALQLGGQTIQNLGAPVNATDAATKQYVDQTRSLRPAATQQARARARPKRCTFSPERQISLNSGQHLCVSASRNGSGVRCAAALRPAGTPSPSVWISNAQRPAVYRGNAPRPGAHKNSREPRMDAIAPSLLRILTIRPRRTLSLLCTARVNS